MQDLQHWIDTDRKLALRLMDLMEECLRTPRNGRGKPEPLKGNWAGWWSRRLTDEHRIVYRATEEFVEFAQARYHYDP
jgi:toxin YoeB